MSTCKLDKSIIARREEAANELYSIDADISARIDYILNFIYNAFGSKLSNWYFQGASENQDGFFEPHMFSEEFYVYKEPSLPNDGCFICKDDVEWGLEEGIPSRWLFEDFEDELTSGIERLKKHNADKKVQAAKKALAKAEEEKKLVDSIKNKLTPAELKALLKKANHKKLKGLG
jgi:hypothetical protein